MTSAKIVDRRKQGQEAAIALGFGACDQGVNETLAQCVEEIQDHGDCYHIVVRK